MDLLIRNPELPEKCGKARIVYEADKERPRREKEVIYLPATSRLRSKMHLLRHGTQFLFSISREVNYESELWFGGMDEEPFLTRLSLSVLREFQARGEDGFFESLKPRQIIEMECITGRKTKRQGDIFAMPVPFSWESIKMMAHFATDQKNEPGRTIVDKDISVYDTRHKFTGMYTPVTIKVASLSFRFFEGDLIAPDHEDLALKGPHVLAQAINLFDPKNAD